MNIIYIDPNREIAGLPGKLWREVEPEGIHIPTSTSEIPIYGAREVSETLLGEDPAVKGFRGGIIFDAFIFPFPFLELFVGYIPAGSILIKKKIEIPGITFPSIGRIKIAIVPRKEIPIHLAQLLSSRFRIKFRRGYDPVNLPLRLRPSISKMKEWKGKLDEAIKLLSSGDFWANGSFPHFVGTMLAKWASEKLIPRTHVEVRFQKDFVGYGPDSAYLYWYHIQFPYKGATKRLGITEGTYRTTKQIVFGGRGYQVRIKDPEIIFHMKY